MQKKATLPCLAVALRDFHMVAVSVFVANAATEREIVFFHNPSNFFI